MGSGPARFPQERDSFITVQVGFNRPVSTTTTGGKSQYWTPMFRVTQAFIWCFIFTPMASTSYFCFNHLSCYPGTYLPYHFLYKIPYKSFDITLLFPVSSFMVTALTHLSFHPRNHIYIFSIQYDSIYLYCPLWYFAPLTRLRFLQFRNPGTIFFSSKFNTVQLNWIQLYCPL